LAHDALQLLSFALLMYIYVLAANLTVDAEYDIYESSYSPGNWLLPAKAKNPVGNTTQMLESGEVQIWQLPTNNTRMNDLGSVMDQMTTVGELTALYYVIQCAVIMTMICKSLWMMDFQPRLSIFMNTVAAAGSELMYLLGVTFVVFFAYVVASILSFSNRMEGFTKLETAAVICFSWMMDGNLDVIEDLSIPGYHSSPWEQALEMFIRFSLPCLGKFFFLNLILGVIQATFTELQQDPDTKDSQTPAAQIWSQLHHRTRRLLRAWPDDKILFQLVHDHEPLQASLSDSLSADPFAISGLFPASDDVDSSEADEQRATLPVLGRSFDKQQLTVVLNTLFQAELQNAKATERRTGEPGTGILSCIPAAVSKALSSSQPNELSARVQRSRTGAEQLKLETSRRSIREESKKWPFWPMWPMWPSIAESVVDRLEEDMNKEFVEAQEADVFEPRDRRKDILQKMTKWMQILGRQNELHLRQLSGVQKLFLQSEPILRNLLTAAKQRQKTQANLKARQVPARISHKVTT